MSNSTEIVSFLGIRVEYWGIIIGIIGIVLAIIALVVPFLERESTPTKDSHFSCS